MRVFRVITNPLGFQVFERSDKIQPEIGTPTRYGNLDRRHFKKIISRANEPIRTANQENCEKKPRLRVIRLYDVRHTMATLLLAKGINPKIVSERLGHSSVLDTYSHVLPTMQEGATSEIEKLMFGT